MCTPYRRNFDFKKGYNLNIPRHYVIMKLRSIICLFSLILASEAKYTEPHCDGKQVIVHLFEWSWDAIGRECEEVLGPKGYCGVQISPPMEHIQGGAWWTRYQPVSYKVIFQLQFLARKFKFFFTVGI